MLNSARKKVERAREVRGQEKGNKRRTGKASILTDSM